MNKKIKEIKEMWDMLQGMLPVGVKQEVLEAILDLDKRLSKLERSSKTGVQNNG